MANESPVYLRLKHYESVESKKDLLSIEMSFLNLLKDMKNYNEIRQEELNLKSKTYKLMKELDLALKKTKATFPFLKIPGALKKEGLEKKEEIHIRKENFDSDLDSQLREIQEKLRAMEE